jgi:hypothetical protein
VRETSKDIWVGFRYRLIAWCSVAIVLQLQRLSQFGGKASNHDFFEMLLSIGGLAAVIRGATTAKTIRDDATAITIGTALLVVNAIPRVFGEMSLEFVRDLFQVALPLIAVSLHLRSPAWKGARLRSLGNPTQLLIVSQIPAVPGTARLIAIAIGVADPGIWGLGLVAAFTFSFGGCFLSMLLSLCFGRTELRAVSTRLAIAYAVYILVLLVLLIVAAAASQTQVHMGGGW